MTTISLIQQKPTSNIDIVPFLNLEKLRFKAVKLFVRSHIITKEQRQKEANPTLTPKDAALFPHHLACCVWKLLEILDASNGDDI